MKTFVEKKRLEFKHSKNSFYFTWEKHFTVKSPLPLFSPTNLLAEKIQSSGICCDHLLHLKLHHKLSLIAAADLLCCIHNVSEVTLISELNKRETNC